MASSSASSSRNSRLTASTSSVIYTNAVYFPNFRVHHGDTPAALNFACINQVYYAYANISEDGGVLLSDEYADTLAPCDDALGALGSLMGLKLQHPFLKVILSIGGPATTALFPYVASDAVLRDNFARSALGLVEASGLDGIDIVWEFPCDEQQGDDFPALLEAVRIYLPEDRYLVTATLPASKPFLQFINLPWAAAKLDFINLVAYDFFGEFSSKTGHQSQLYNMNKDEPSGSSGVDYILKAGVSGKKILLGIPLYGRSFLHASGTGQKYRGVGGTEGCGTFEYKDLPRQGTEEKVDKRAVAAHCVGGDGGFVTYDNPETVKAKATFCKQKGLGGLFYLHAPMDAKDSKRSLILTGYKSLHYS